MNQDNIIDLKESINTLSEEEQKIIKLRYFKDFNFDNPVKINLNSSNNKDLKEMFEILLKELINKKFILELKIQEDYKIELYKDVCNEYINALNEEIKETIESDLWKEIFETKDS